jgi:transposase InsO family protein
MDARSTTPSLNVVGQGYRKGNLYYLPKNNVSSHQAKIPAASIVNTSLLDYHHRLSHVGVRPLKRLLRLLNITPSVLNEIDVQKCTMCVQAKMHRRPLTSCSNHRATIPGQLIHSNVASYKEISREGYKYYVTFINDCSKHVSIYPMKLKSQVFACFKIFRTFFKKDGQHKILSLRSDNGGDYISNEFTNYLAQAGIKHEPGPPHSPELNGVAERANRTIGNLVRCSLLSAGIPKSYWADALRHILHSLNSIPCHTPLGFKSPNLILG